LDEHAELPEDRGPYFDTFQCLPGSFGLAWRRKKMATVAVEFGRETGLGRPSWRVRRSAGPLDRMN
jgi:hypothetical protein